MEETEDELYHYGILRKSGRYPWGSGTTPYQRSMSFYSAVDHLKKQGLSETTIAKGLGFETTTQLRATRSIAKAEIVKSEELQIARMKKKGMSNVAIGERLGIPEPTVRARLKTIEKGRQDVILTTADLLKSRIDDGTYLDLGLGTANHLGISPERLKTSIEVLKEQGYQTIEVYVEQLGNPGHNTTYKLLAPNGTTQGDVLKNMDRIQTVAAFSDNGGRTYREILPPKSVDPKRVDIAYGGQGGELADGMIELRRGVEDLSLGKSHYAQVRIKVGDDHFIKGMATYSDNLPNGIDIRFNTNKADTGNKLDVLKRLESDPENPFKSTIRQKYYKDKNGKEQLSPLNIVGTEDPDGQKFPGEEGAWGKWSKTLSSQMLSKQRPALAQEQLGLAYDIKKAEYDEILSLTNPTVKKKLLESFADAADSASVKLKAAALPGTSNHVLIPIKSMKDNEIYAPNYKNGQEVVLIRHPHAGVFEIPQLKVNNKNPEARRILGDQPIDAVGINSRVASKLSGADFDGDTVLVIPTDGKKIKTAPSLAGLRNFDPNSYQNLEQPQITNKTLQIQMGNISNLITDMTIKGATDDELARAERHAMVVIDSRKHRLDYKLSAQDNDIKALKNKYQREGSNSGASTLISKASSEQRVNKRKLRSASQGGPIDPATGEKVYVETGETYTNKKGEVVFKQTKSTKMAEVKDARSLVSSQATKMEMIYADHANKLKTLANDARKEAYVTPKLKYSPSAKDTYQTEVNSLLAKLNIAKKNKPLERQAQLIGSIAVAQKKAANPDLSKDEIKKLKNRELSVARNRVGAQRQNVVVTPREWEAIQAGAISDHRLTEILANTNVDDLKQLALPRSKVSVSPAIQTRAKAMASNGYSQADIASALGISTSSVNEAING